MSIHNSASEPAMIKDCKERIKPRSLGRSLPCYPPAVMCRLERVVGRQHVREPGLAALRLVRQDFNAQHDRRERGSVAVRTVGVPARVYLLVNRPMIVRPQMLTQGPQTDQLTWSID
jgi:hypothetical protein